MLLTLYSLWTNFETRNNFKSTDFIYDSLGYCITQLMSFLIND